ncbi:hypothetical protein [Streptomyces fructofermentans]|uniref:Uncharacterized protein n=1 Tax=Streptomyces fructofermentans TaxID=152141 RepID=A0A918NS24_9ACTN|nr:hypothetical protein [Streptomyces fructofermentans]GGX91478.1 hypothetical protein GCM10010515_68240 [Streptomyces fructofermentans]
MRVTKRTVTCQVELAGTDATAADIETLIGDARAQGHDFVVTQTQAGFSLRVNFGEDRNGAGDLLRHLGRLTAAEDD